MTPNRSLELSLSIQNLINKDLLEPINSVFPYSVLKNHSQEQLKTRDRIYNTENTALTMVLTAFQADKTLQNSVNIFKKVFEYNNKKSLDLSNHLIKEEKENDLKSNIKKRGRPKLYKVRFAKSKTKSISPNTAAYSKARSRLDLKLLDDLFETTKDFSDLSLPTNKWHDMDVFVTDGTYFQLQDSTELHDKYGVKTKSEEFESPYPQGLLQGITHQRSGFLWNYTIGNRHQSELELVFPMLNNLPPSSLLLADDLYNTYAIFSLILKNKLEIIVPGKRVKKYRVIKTLSEGDEIVEVNKTAHPSWLPKEIEIHKKIQLRRIKYNDSYTNKEYILYTTILNEKISKTDLIAKYLTRWDIEITIREIKTIMDINVARSKTEEMVFKELRVAFIAYNLIRKIIAQSVEGATFPPKKDIIQEFFENNKDIFIDKKGRVYNRWSPGRHGKIAGRNQATCNS